MLRAMKRFSAPASVYPDPSRPPDDDDSDASLSDGSKKVKTAQSFESLFNSESLSDIVLDINQGEFVFHAHKMIVGLKSERLAALITSVASIHADNCSKPVLYLIEMPECSAIFSRFLYFIYSGAVWLHRDYVVPLFKLSIKYGVGALATHCENYIIQLLNKCLNVDTNCANPPPTMPVTTVCDLYEDNEYREETRKVSFCVLSHRFADLIRTERWISCSWTTVRDLLRSDECACEENLILVAATDWMKRNKLQDKVRIQEILSSIRYPRLPRRVLYHLHTTASFRNFPQVQDLIDAAIRYHCFKDVPEAQNEFSGLQYRMRWKSRSRHTLCGGEPIYQSESQDNPPHNNWHFEEGDESVPIADVNDPSDHCHSNSTDLLANSRPPEVIHSHHHPICRDQISQTTRHAHRHGPRSCAHHSSISDTMSSTFHPVLSPVVAVQPRIHYHSNSSRDTEPTSSSQDISLQINIHSHTQV